jgi:hypothetical protein
VRRPFRPLLLTTPARSAMRSAGQQVVCSLHHRNWVWSSWFPSVADKL